MSVAAKSVEFTAKFSGVTFRAVPEGMRVDSDSLSPDVRPCYDRIVAADGGDFVSMTRHGNLRLSGTFTQIRQEGTERRGQVFVAFTSKTKNGILLDFAGDMIEKFSDLSTVGFAKVRVVPGKENGRFGRFMDLDVFFPET